MAFLSFNFFFTRPYFTLYVHDHGDLATLGFFLIMAFFSGELAARIQREMERNRAMLERLTNINDFTRMMATAPDTDTVGADLAFHIAKTFRVPVWVIVHSHNNHDAVYGHDGEAELTPLSEEVIEPLIKDDNDTQQNDLISLNLSTAQGSMGHVILKTERLSPSSRELARILCDLGAVTLERAHLVAELEQTRVVSETEQLRSALLSSVSHDLRTPLASIIGSTSSLLEYGDNIRGQDRRELMQTVLDEAERLNRYIQNLLDMTRLGGGKLMLTRDWVDISDIVYSSLERLRKTLSPYQLQIDIPEDVPLLYVHGVFVEQALVNVLDNAANFSPVGGTIVIRVDSAEESITIDVCDQGPGIPEEAREKVFDMFYTVREGDRKQQGTGLGLAICRGLVETHGGRVTVHDGLDSHGTCIHISLPNHKLQMKESA